MAANRRRLVTVAPSAPSAHFLLSPIGNRQPLLSKPQSVTTGGRLLSVQLSYKHKHENLIPSPEGVKRVKFRDPRPNRSGKIRPQTVECVIFGRLINADRKYLVMPYPVWVKPDVSNSLTR